MDLFLREAGPARDEEARGTILFIHGFPLDGSMWEAQLDALPAGWRGLAPDLRGFGRTETLATAGAVPSGREAGGRIARGDEPVLTMPLLADDLAGLIEREAVGPVVVCGLSMGGYVAFELCRRHRQLVRALILLDTRASADSDEARENRMRTAQTVRDAGAAPVALAMVPALLSEPTRAERSDLIDTVRRMILDTPPATIIAALAGMAGRHDSTSDLASLDVPTLVIVGDGDTITPVDGARAMADAMPDARLAIIPGAAHLPPLERPDDVNRLIVEFLGALG